MDKMFRYTLTNWLHVYYIYIYIIRTCRVNMIKYSTNIAMHLYLQWECKSDMDNLYRFGEIEVICEGYDYPDDPYITKGSCGLEYTLEYTKEGKIYKANYCINLLYSVTGLSRLSDDILQMFSSIKPNNS